MNDIGSAKTLIQNRRDLAWAIAVGGISAVAFATFLFFAWYFASTLFLIFAGFLLGVALNSVTNLFGRLVALPHALRLTIVCVVLAAMLSGVVFLGGATIAQQTSALSKTIKSQLTNVKSFLDRNGVDTSYLDFVTSTNGNADNNNNEKTPPANAESPGQATAHNLPSSITSSGGAIVSQTLKLVLGTVGAVGNFFIVLFLGLTFAAQPYVYRDGLLALSPRQYKSAVTTVVDRIGETLERWLLAQMVTMAVVFMITWIGLELIGVPGAFILGVQAGLLTFIPTVGALLGGLIVVLASLASGWFAAATAFALFLGIHALESYILTPILQRQALDIPPATLFAFQILLGVVFGIWGLALALPLVAIGKVVIDYLREDRETPALPARAEVA